MLLPLAIASCGGDEKDEPETTANDPEGTTLVYLHHGDYVELARDTHHADENGYGYDISMGISVNKSNNFVSDTGDKIVSVGKVKNISEIKSIPNSGWVSETAIVPGNGYVFMGSYVNTYYARIYVVDFITSTDGGIIGATIKYQKNWYHQ